MPASARPSSYHYMVDEPQLRKPGGYGSRARGTERPDSDLDLLVNSHREVLDRRQYRQHGVTEAYRYGRDLHAG